MAIEYTLLKRFSKALATFFQGSATLVTLTGHSLSTPRIYVKRGDDVLERPSLILDIIDTTPFIDDVDGVYNTEVQCIAYAASRIEALDIGGAVLALCKQNTTTLVDAKFETDNIRTKSIKALGVYSQGESIFDPVSVRRTERSDVVAPNRHVAVVPILITWLDTTP